MNGTCCFAILAIFAYVQAVSSQEITCKQHSECPEKMACESVSSQCVDPCLTHTKCGTDASCVIDDHLAKCKCNPGTLGQPYESCSSSAFDILTQGLAG